MFFGLIPRFVWFFIPGVIASFWYFGFWDWRASLFSFLWMRGVALLHTKWITKDDTAIGIDKNTMAHRPYTVLYATGNGAYPFTGELYSHGHHGDMDTETNWPYNSPHVSRRTMRRSFQHFLLLLQEAFIPHLPIFHGDFYAVRTAEARKNWNVGGELDAILYMRALILLITENKQGKFVLFGVSRGSATIFNALCIMSEVPEWETVIRPRIACVILFGAFARVETVLQYRFSWPIRWCVRKFLASTSYDPTWDPIKRAIFYPWKVPTLMVTSKADHIVPAAATVELYNAANAHREKAKVDPIRLLILQNVLHNYNFARNEDRKALFEAVRDMLSKTV